MNQLNYCLAHDHLAQDGGAERVLDVLSQMYKDAPIFTLLSDKEVIEKKFSDRKIETSIIQRLPGGVRFYKWYLPLMPTAVEFFDLRDYDIVISSASAFIKGLISSTKTMHVCYCHTPTRYLWSDSHQYINELKYNKYFKKIIAMNLTKLRVWDRMAADRVDFFIANSKTVQKRIEKYYHREAEIIYPPVSLDLFENNEKPDDYYLVGGRLEPYKRVDIVIEAFKKLPDRKLKIFGNGSDFKRLQKIALGYNNIQFTGRVSQKELVDLFVHCLAFINPQLEDFGITMVEAMASGRPVIARQAGGALEIVKPGVSGIFFEKEESSDIVFAIKEMENMKFDADVIKQEAKKFSRLNFETKIKDFIKDKWEIYNH